MAVTDRRYNEEDNMAKFNVTVEIDYIDEEGNLDEEICDKIIEAIVGKISEKAEKNLEERATEALDKRLAEMEETAGAKLNAMMDEFFETPRDVTDRWGQVVEKGVTVKQKLSAACDKFMDQPLDANGNPVPLGNYNQKYRTRVDYFVAKSVDFSMENAIKTAVTTVKNELQKKVEIEVKAQMGEKLANIIGLEKLINN